MFDENEENPFDEFSPFDSALDAAGDEDGELDHPDPEHPFNDPDFAWTECQERALERADDFLGDPSRDFFGIFGAAGTGKTAVIQKIIAEQNGTVAMAAPTHQAVGVLREMCPIIDARKTFATVHSLLGLYPAFNDVGEIERFKPTDGEIEGIDADLVVVDECSMIDEEVAYYLGEAQNESPRSTDVIFMGDPYQLRPVTEGTDSDTSPTFQVPHVELKEVVRHDGAIVECVQDIRSDMGERDLVTAPRRPRSSDLCTYAGPGVDETWFERAVESVKSDETTSKLLAYTNTRVEDLNSAVRSVLRGDDAPRFREGDRLVAAKNVVEGAPNDDGADIILRTQEECTVDRAERTELAGYECWKLDVFVSSLREIHTVYALSYGQWKTRKSEYKTAANAGNWDRYYDLRKPPFAYLRSPYATTVHKSQGASLDEVFVDQGDILSTTHPRDPETRDRLLYVSHTRAAEQLHVCDETGRFRQTS